MTNVIPTFWVRCVGYRDVERYFTVGQEYEVCDGYIVNDDGHCYSRDASMRPDGDIEQWYLSAWYDFEIVEMVVPNSFDITIDDMIF